MDVTITSPNRGDAGPDPPASAYARKMKRYRRAIPVLAEQGIRLRPMCWSADGRPHPAVVRTMRYAAAAAARQKPGLDPIGFAQRWASDIATAIQSRRACVALSVLPKANASEDWLVSGDRQALGTMHQGQDAEEGDSWDAAKIQPFDDVPPDLDVALREEQTLTTRL